MSNTLTYPILLEDKFKEYFGDQGVIEKFFAPGRVNLIGEHIDYNGGFVFPAALTIGITALVRKNEGSKIRLRSTNIEGTTTIDLTNDIIYREEDQWGNYPKGVIANLKSKGLQIPGCDILYSSNLPDGAGLSSSASIEVLTGYMMLVLSHTKEIDRVSLAQICQKTENEFIGVNCGIMDQFSIALGKKDNAILLDCNTLNYQYVPIIFNNYTLVIMNTNKRRELAESNYNIRRQECEQALTMINRKKKIQNLCDASLDIIKEVLSKNTTLFKRAKHVISENQRVLESVKYLQDGDLISFGKLMTKSHESLKNDYEVTGKELDTIVEAALKIPGCIGARMTGAGFGGCAIAIVDNFYLDVFKKQVRIDYQSKTGLTPTFYESLIGDGVFKFEIEEA